MFIITRFGDSKKFIRETNSNFDELSAKEDLIILEDDDSLSKYCFKVNYNFKLLGVDCFVYPQMNIDSLFDMVTKCFKIIKTNADFIQT
jgi:hypothetical protein